MSPKKIQYDHSNCFPKHRGGAEYRACVKRNEAAGTPLPVKVVHSTKDVVVKVTSKKCNRCGEVKPASAFTKSSKTKDGLTPMGRCQQCHREYQRTNAHRKSYRRNYLNQDRYGITSAQVQAMIDEREGRCDLCAQVPAPDSLGRTLHVEHCHDALHVRGMTCGSDNTLLGAWEPIRDIPGVVDRIAAHLDPANHVARRPKSESDGSRTFWNYGITEADWQAILERQGRRCNICHTKEPGRQGWHRDHAHDDTQAVRGALCHRCNTQLLPHWERLLDLSIEPASALNEYLARGPVDIPKVEEPVYVPLNIIPQLDMHADCSHDQTPDGIRACIEASRAWTGGRHTNCLHAPTVAGRGLCRRQSRNADAYLEALSATLTS